MRQAQDLVHELLTADLDTEVRGELDNDLLEAVYRSNELSALEPLLRSGRLDDQKSLVFVLSEIGTLVEQAMPWLDELLDVNNEFVRRFAVTAVMQSRSRNHARTTARSLMLLYDAPQVRLAALRLAAWGSLAQLETCIEFLSDPLGSAVRNLVEGRDGATQDLLWHEDIAVAMIGLALATRSGLANVVQGQPHSYPLAEGARWLARRMIRDTE